MNFCFGRMAERIMLHEYAKSGSLDLCLSVVDEGVNIDTKSSLGDTALHWAARGGFQACIEGLVQKGANVNAQNNQGDTPLHLAAFKNHLEACRSLVKAGANRELLNKDGKRPLDLSRSVQIKAIVAPEEEDADGYEGSGSEEDF